MRIILLWGIFLISVLLFACAPKVGPEEKPMVAEDFIREPKAAAKEHWEEKWERTLQEAKKEGKVVIYASTGAAASRDMLIKNMKEKYGLAVDMVVGRGAEISQKIFSERNAGLYLADVYIGGPTTMVTLFIPSAIFDPIEKALILPEVYETKNWRGNKLPYLDKGRRYVIRWAANVQNPLAINTNLVRPEEMASYMDILNPKWRGKIMLNDPSTTGSGQDFFYFVGMKLMGPDFMRQLAKQEPVILRDARLMAEWLVRGKYPVLLGPGPVQDLLLEYQKEGVVPVLFINYMKEGGFIAGGAVQVGLINKAPHPGASAIFINWLLSREGQMAWSIAQGDNSQRIDVSTDYIEPSKIPDSSKHYFEEDEEGLKEKGNTSALAREIFNIK